MATCALKIDALLGEGLVWSTEEHVLYWVDILKGFIHRFDPVAKKNTTIELSQKVTSLGLRKGGRFILTLRDSIALFDPHSNSLDIIASPEKQRVENRFNDGKCDRLGRFWCNSMNEVDMSKDTGSLYRIDNDYSIHQMERNVILGNGMGWSPDNRLFYFTQTLRHKIFVYDFDLQSGAIANPRVFAEVKGNPDGLTVDADGCVWSAVYGSSCVICFNPQGNIERTIHLPVPRVTNCTFGGEKLDTLYISTAREGMTQNEIEKFPLSGSLFAIKPGVTGLPEIFYREKSEFS